MMFRFAYPVLLFMLVVVAGWVAVSLWRKPSSIAYSTTSGLAQLAGSGNHFLGRVPMVLRAVCLVLLILAGSRPEFYNVSRDIRSPGVDIVLCLDTSGSMQALDFQLMGNRFPDLRLLRK